MTGFGIRRPYPIDSADADPDAGRAGDGAPTSRGRLPGQARWALAGVAALLIASAVYVGTAEDPVGVEQSSATAQQWTAQHPAPSDTPGGVAATTATVHAASGRILTASLDNVSHRVLIASCMSDPCVPGKPPGRTSTAAALHGDAAGLQLIVTDDGLPHISWHDADGPRLLVCSQADCLPGSFL